MNRNQIVEYKIKDFWIDELLSSLKNILEESSLKQLNSLNIYDGNKEAIIISFDNVWRPFLGITKGYNKQEERTYFNNIPQLVQLIINKYRSCNRKEPGGRVFLDKNSAYYTDELRKNNVLFLLKYSEIRSIPLEIRDYLFSLKLEKLGLKK